MQTAKALLLLSSFLCSSLVVHAAEPSRYEKIQSLFQFWGITEERSYFDELAPLDGKQTRREFEATLKFFDPTNTFRRYATWDDQKLTVYRDRDTKQVLDFYLAFQSEKNNPQDAKRLTDRLKQASSLFNQAARGSTVSPLTGLKIAIDPGHMGGKFWDEKTGKFVHNPKTKKTVSEGDLTLKVSLLLAQQLKALGANVLLTRGNYEPVSKLNPKKYRLKSFIEHELRSVVDAKWFENEILNAKISSELNTHPRIQKIRSKDEEQRFYYFINREDLAARAKLINSFKPDLTLIIHFDALIEPAGRKDNLQTSHNEVRAYVPGNFFPEEMATREARANLVKNLFDAHRWYQSNMFTVNLVKSLSKKTNVKIKDDPTDYGATRIVDGVYARNLALTRQISEGAMSYVEILYYNYENEFTALTSKKLNKTRINGKVLKYPPRLDAIVDGLRDGILDYVESVDQPQSDRTKSAPQP